MKNKKPIFEPLTLLEDEPVRSHEIDELGLLPFSKVVAGAAVGTTGPFTIGIFGGWGTGKSSVLMQAKSLIEHQNKDVVTVWFNAWRYEQESQPLVPLIASLVNAIEDKKSTLKGSSEKAIRAFKDLGNALRALAFGLSADVSFNVPSLADLNFTANVKDISQRLEEFRESQRDALLDKTALMNILERMDELATSQGLKAIERPKIVVFIDDLDRCHPDNGLRLLESIKLVFAQHGFVFVLAVDHAKIESYLLKRYKEEFGIEDYGRSGTSYFDKIVQLPLPLPAHEGERFRPYVDNLMARPAIANSPEIQKTFKSMVDVLVLGAAANPRSLVRLINNLLVDWRLWQVLDKEVDPELVRMSAVSRTLRQHLGEAHYGKLVRDEKLCEAIAHEGIKVLRGQVSQVPAGEARDEDRDLILRLLELDKDLLSLLEHDAARVWLTDHRRRLEVEGFLLTQREESLEGVRSEYEIIEAAIRKSLGKSPGAQISDVERSRINVLDLSFKPITDSGLKHVTNLDNLESLILQGTQVTGPGLKQLARMMHLDRLDLTGTQITDAGLKYVATLGGLQELRLANTLVTDAGLKCVGNLDLLSALNLNGNRVTDEGVEHLAALRSLYRLHLSDTQVKGSGLKHLAVLEGRLRELYLDNTGITDAALEDLVSLKRLFRLDISSTRVTDAGLKHFAGLEGGVNGLILADTQVTDAGLRHLANVRDLKVLNLDDTGVTDTGMKHLAKLGRLKYLSLNNTQVTDAGLESLLALGELEDLSLANTKVTDAGKEKLKNKRPDITLKDDDDI